MTDFNTNLAKYAELIVAVGVNVSKGHTVVLQISVDQAPLARLITQKAYALGAAEVLVQWTDDQIQREFLLHADEERLENIPAYKVEQTEDWLKKGASRISVVSSDPGALAGVDANRVATYQAASGKAMMGLRKATQANKVSWTVVAAAGKEWAQKSFLNLKLKKRKQNCGMKSLKQRELIQKIPLLLGKNTMKHYAIKQKN